jgi:hypothetical protein
VAKLIKSLFFFVAGGSQANIGGAFSTVLVENYIFNQFSL